MSLSRPSLPAASVALAVLALSMLEARAVAAAAETAPAPAPWKRTLSLTVRESFDSNVFLQDATPDPAVAGAAAPRQSSFVTTLAASIGVDGRLAPGLSLSASYAPETNIYHSATQESFSAHRGVLNLAGRIGDTPWTLQNSGTWIDGGKDGPVFGGPGGVPAVGGIPLRDRRAAFIERTSLKLTHSSGRWLVRPAATLYVHDFHTVQSRRSGYENYVDRREWTAGVDVGYEVVAKTRLVAGFRYGRQDQFKLHGIDSPYDSVIHRYLVGVEGTLAPWLQLNVLAGPETRAFAPGTAAGFDRNRMLLWIDATAIVTAGRNDTVTLTGRRFEQPAFSSQSVYEDITYEVSWRHRCGPAFTAGAGFKAYGGDWPGPVTREDWILTPSVLLQYAVNKRCGLELSYSLDRAESRVPGTAGREFKRHLGTAGLKYTF
jgi:hypothetical protein